MASLCTIDAHLTEQVLQRLGAPDCKVSIATDGTLLRPLLMIPLHALVCSCHMINVLALDLHTGCSRSLNPSRHASQLQLGSTLFPVHKGYVSGFSGVLSTLINECQSSGNPDDAVLVLGDDPDAPEAAKSADLNQLLVNHTDVWP